MKSGKEIRHPNEDIWFPAMKYGFGWGLPFKWQGWIVLTAYVLLVTLGSLPLAVSPKHIIWFLPYMLILTIIFVFICWKKGEKAKWRWGKIRRDNINENVH